MRSLFIIKSEDNKLKNIMETIIQKVSDTEYEKVTPQEDKVEKISLDNLLSKKESLLQGIQNNKDAIIFQTAKLEEVDAEIIKVRNLGLKSSVEIQVEKQAILEEAKVEPLEEILTPIEKII